MLSHCPLRVRSGVRFPVPSHWGMCFCHLNFSWLVTAGVPRWFGLCICDEGLQHLPTHSGALCSFNGQMSYLLACSLLGCLPLQVLGVLCSGGNTLSGASLLCGLSFEKKYFFFKNFVFKIYFDTLGVLGSLRLL